MAIKYNDLYMDLRRRLREAGAYLYHTEVARCMSFASGHRFLVKLAPDALPAGHHKPKSVIRK